MENKFTIQADVDTNSADNPVGLEVWINDKVVYNFDSLRGPAALSIDVDDVDDAEHELKIILKNKTAEHTKIDDQGNILTDSVVTVKNIMFDGFDLGHTFSEKAVYKHNFNGTGPEIEDKFFGTMGCNGSVSLKFTTPMYLWLLENM